MENTNNNSNIAANNSDFDNSTSNLNGNQESGESENGINHFFLVMGDENHDLREVIRHWETLNDLT